MNFNFDLDIYWLDNLDSDWDTLFGTDIFWVWGYLDFDLNIDVEMLQL